MASLCLEVKTAKVILSALIQSEGHALRILGVMLVEARAGAFFCWMASVDFGLKLPCLPFPGWHFTIEPQLLPP